MENKTSSGNNVWCILGAVMGGLSVLLGFSVLIGIVGLGLAVYGMVDCKKKGEKGKILAIVAIIVSALSIMIGGGI